MHFEPTKDVQASIQYCCKDDTKTGETYSLGKPPALKGKPKTKIIMNDIALIDNVEFGKT